MLRKVRWIDMSELRELITEKMFEQAYEHFLD